MVKKKMQKQKKVKTPKKKPAAKNKIDLKALRESLMSSLAKPKKAEAKNRVLTGVTGLDESLNGGIPQGNLVLLTGSCGSGKSTLAMQFLREGALNGENGVYITFEESPEQVWANAAQFWDVNKLKKRIKIIHPAIYKFEALVKTLEDSIDRNNAKRAVIDSISVLSFYLSDAFDIRKGILDLNKKLRKEGATILALSEVQEASEGLSTNGVEEFVADGVIVLHVMREGHAYTRGINVRKMRGTTHSMRIIPLQITTNGIEVYPNQEVFTEGV